MSSNVRRLTGVEPDTRCARCKITAAESVKRGAFPTGIDHPVYHETHSFYQHLDDGKHFCPPCHREMKLAELFDLMDKKGISL
jgi:hypothetical protein